MCKAVEDTPLPWPDSHPLPRLIGSNTNRPRFPEDVSRSVNNLDTPARIGGPASRLVSRTASGHAEGCDAADVCLTAGSELVAAPQTGSGEALAKRAALKLQL